MNYLETEYLPLTDIVGGRIDLDKLIEELDLMYPDKYPICSLSDWESGRLAGAIEVIRYLKSKRNF